MINKDDTVGLLKKAASLEAAIRADMIETIAVQQQSIDLLVQKIAVLAQACIYTVTHGYKILICGNGGSAADAQHFAAELVGRFQKERKALPAFALSANTALLTALTNDYSGDIIFSRQIEALAQKGDLVIGITTSGKSVNIINALTCAQQRGCMTAVLTGNNGGSVVPLADIAIIVPSASTPRIQEVHGVIIHSVCHTIEDMCEDL